MTTKHNISRAAEIYAGAYHPGTFNTNKRAGAPLTPGVVQVSLGAPTLGAVDTIATAQAVAAAGPLTLDGDTDLSSAAAGRNVTITSAGDDTGITFTVTGVDGHGIPVVEVITGASAGTAAGAKAFKRVDSVVASGAAAGNVSVGDGDVLGLPYYIRGLMDLPCIYVGTGGNEIAAATVVAGDTTVPATGTTGDVRGTVETGTTALDGTSEVFIYQIADGSSPEALGGVPQFAG
jgi:hypothetical protein